MKSLAEVLADTLVLGIGPMARLWPLAKLLEMATRERERWKINYKYKYNYINMGHFQWQTGTLRFFPIRCGKPIMNVDDFSNGTEPSPGRAERASRGALETATTEFTM
jgi:hypothetical protein